ncbi:HEAT repeat domain-containing protein [candidate division KSB1 bacterium]|nr:HEAT repeat domain-containing protein [candidate division KSB1 bacterium]
MKNLPTIFVLAGLQITLFFTGGLTGTSPAAMQTGADLNSRWQWALQTAPSQKFTGQFWIGYQIAHWMDAESHIGCRDSKDPSKIPFEKLLEKSMRFNGSGPNALSAPAKPVSQNERLELRAVVLLFKSKFTANGKLEISKVAFTDRQSPFNLKELPFIWLDEVDRHESAAHLQQLYATVAAQSIKKDIVVALGLHQDCDLAGEKLKAIVTSNEPDELRKDAVFWLAQQENKDVLDVLKKIAHQDRSESVREQAVFALYIIKSEPAIGELITLAKKATHHSVRQKAIFWLGQIAGERATAALEEVVYNDTETEIQKQAVFALSQLPAPQSLEKLIKVAKTHPNAEIRKQAIFWIGQSEAESAVDFLVELIKGK